MDNSRSVPPGYKQTDVGVIPEDWEVKRLDEVAEILNGGTPSTSKPDFWDGYIMWCTPTDITALQGRKYLSQTARTITTQGLNASSAKLIPPNSVVMTSRATIGVCAINTVPVATNQGFKSFILSEDTDTEFLYYLLQTKKQEFMSLCSGSTFLEIGKTKLAAFEVELPREKSEQRAIAEVLSDVDALLAALERLIAKKRAIKRGAMQQLLTGKTRLPGFNGPWINKRLDTVAEICNGGTPSTNQPEYWDGQIMWCTPTDVTALEGFKYLSKTTRTITPLGLRASSAELIPANCVVMTSRATIGECAITTVPIATNQGFKSFVPFDDIDTEFLYYLLQTKKRDFLSMCSGSTFPEISKSQVAAFEIELPANKTEQSAIATVLSDMDAEIAALEARRDKTRALKQGMMQQLLTGRIRLV